MDIVGTTRGASFSVVGVALVVVIPPQGSTVDGGESGSQLGGVAGQLLEALAKDWVVRTPPTPADSSEDISSCAEQPVPSLPQASTPPVGGPRVQRVQRTLTQREREVLRLLACGATNRGIASRLFISPKTASVHVSRILTKLDASTRTEAAALAHAAGLVQPEDLGPRAMS